MDVEEEDPIQDIDEPEIVIDGDDDGEGDEEDELEDGKEDELEEDDQGEASISCLIGLICTLRHV